MSTSKVLQILLDYRGEVNGFGATTNEALLVLPDLPTGYVPGMSD